MRKLAAFAGLILLAAVGTAVYFFQPPSALAYEEVHMFRVGPHAVTLETQSFTIAQGDNGAAKIIVLAGGQQTVLDSWFNNDLFSNIHPAYISRQNVDDHWRRDLVIWQPTYAGGLAASAYISSEDGRLHTLTPPLQRQRLWD